MKKYILFDLDGTLTDPMEGSANQRQGDWHILGLKLITMI